MWTSCMIVGDWLCSGEYAVRIPSIIRVRTGDGKLTLTTTDGATLTLDLGDEAESMTRAIVYPAELS